MRQGEPPWKVEFRPSAHRELQQLVHGMKLEALETIQELAENPFAEGADELRGHRGLYRIRCCRDAYRVVYRVSEKERKVIVLRVRPRGSAYHGLEKL